MFAARNRGGAAAAASRLGVAPTRRNLVQGIMYYFSAGVMYYFSARGTERQEGNPQMGDVRLLRPRQFTERNL